MLFGVSITPTTMFLTGVVSLLTLLFQFLQGKRIIKFKGATHRKVHAATGTVLVVLALAHGAMGFAWWLSLR